MTQPAMTRSQLAAFVDGELSPEEAAAVVMHLADHPQDQAFVDDLFAANAALAAAFDAPMREPLPLRIRQAIHPAPGSTISPALRPAPLALAGGLALAAGLVAAVALFDRPVALDLALGPVKDGSALAQVLDTLPSGTVQDGGDGRQVMVLATLPTPDGHCREIEVVDRDAAEIALGLACRGPGTGWSLAVVLTEPLQSVGTEDGFIAADGAEQQGLTAFLDRRGAGPALSPADEAALIGADWQP